MIRLNRALAHLKEGGFDAALRDTQYPSFQANTPEKALYRASQALYGLGRFLECQENLKQLGNCFQGNADAVKMRERVHQRLNEQQHCRYDFKLMYNELSQQRPPHLDHATFVGPVITKPSQGRGRGLFTTKALKAGELIMCEKAFTHCYASTVEDNSEASSKISLLLSSHTDRITMGTQSDLITTTVQKLRRTPFLRSQFTALHHGS